jgi:hypothetical protein
MRIGATRAQFAQFPGESLKPRTRYISTDNWESNAAELLTHRAGESNYGTFSSVEEQALLD